MNGLLDTKARVLAYISNWEKRGYPHGIPDEADARLEALNKAPSYRNICRALLKNDLALTTLGFARPKSDAYMALKRIEIEARNERLRSNTSETEEGL